MREALPSSPESMASSVDSCRKTTFRYQHAAFRVMVYAVIIL